MEVPERLGARLREDWILTRLTGSEAAIVVNNCAAAVLVTLVLAQGVQHTLRLLLSGVVVGMVFGALSALAMFWDPEILRAMQSFLGVYLAFAKRALIASLCPAACARRVALA